MTKDTIEKAFKRQQALMRQFEPLSLRIERLLPEFHIHPIVADPAHQLTRSLHGAAEDLRRSLTLDTVPTLSSPLDDIRLLGAELHEQFRLPKPLEFPNLLESTKMNAAARALAPYRDLATSLSHTIGAMSTPWLNTQHEIRSLTGITGLNELGQVLQTPPTFDVEPAKHLRSLLGDWRKKIDWPSEIFTDPLARSDFYLDLGLQPTLTEFPPVAFHQALTITGIERSPPPLVVLYHRADDPHQGEQEAGLERNNAAHDRLQRFETQIRRFIDEQMASAFGDIWIEHRVPAAISQKWRERRATARDNGEEAPQPLIAYADFTDYEPIIVSKTNWKEVFAPFFRRKTSVQESLRRLYPIRVCTMHARFITQDDELYLLAETQRLLRAMGIGI